MARGEVEVLLRRVDDWMAGLVDNMPAPAGDGGCTTEDTMGPTTRLDLLRQVDAWPMEPPALLVMRLLKWAESRSWLN